MCQPVPSNLLSYKSEPLIFSLNHPSCSLNILGITCWMHYIILGYFLNLKIVLVQFKLKIGKLCCLHTSQAWGSLKHPRQTTCPLWCFSRYDPKTNQWSSDVAPTSTCRTSVGVAVLGGYLYAVGGQDGVSCLNIVERYLILKVGRKEKWVS